MSYTQSLPFNAHDFSKIVVLTGAGISAESGLKTFRDNNGLWENHRIEEVATPEAFIRNPDLVYRFYNLRRKQLQSPDVKPNAAHLALAEFERKFKGEMLLVTQNVDNLHEKAGSKKVLHMHGELLSARCCHSGQSFKMNDSFGKASRCKCCVPSQPIRPDIVWFSEMPMHMDEIYQGLNEAELFVSIGTSGTVYPAAGFVEQANFNGAHSVELNLEPGLGKNNFSQGFYGPASELVPAFFK